MIHRRLIYLFCLGCCTLFFLAYQLWFSWFALMALLLLPIFSLLMSLLTMRTAHLKLFLPRSIPMGTPQALALRHGSLLCPPPWRCKLEVRRPITGQTWDMAEDEPLPTDHCGALVCSIIKPRIYDYLGLFSMKMNHDPKKTMLVLPTPIPMDLPGVDSDTVHVWKPKWGGGFAENHELRLYQPGDSIRQIHWKLSAKTGSLILRQPMEPVRQEVTVAMELCGTPEELDRKFGRLMWLGHRLTDRERPFTLQVYTGNGQESWLIADRSEFDKVLHTLLRTSPAENISANAPAVSSAHYYYIGGGADET